MDPRLRAVCDLRVPIVRENAGLHTYDGVIQDLSPDGVRAALARLHEPGTPADQDEAHLQAFEQALRISLGDLEEHRSNPLVHLDNLDLSVYDREYAPKDQRDRARRRHLAAWPDAVDMALGSLDRVPAPTAGALVNAVAGLASGLDEDDPVAAAGLAAQRRLVAHLKRVAAEGDPDPAIGENGLSKLLSGGEAIEVDLGKLARQADIERDRLRTELEEACGRLTPGKPVG